MKTYTKPAGSGQSILRRLEIGLPIGAALRQVERDFGLWARLKDMAGRAEAAGHRDLRVTLSGAAKGVGDNHTVIFRCHACGAGVKVQVDAENHLWTAGRAVETVCPGTEGRVWEHQIPEQGDKGADLHPGKVGYQV